MADYVFRWRSDMTVKLIQHMGSDSSIIAAAIVSTGGPNSLDFLKHTSPDYFCLIDFLLRNRHGTPFEAASMTFFIEAPLFVFREFHRHRVGWSYNEESARYRALKPTFWLPPEDRKLVQVGRPGNYTFEMGTPQQHAQTVRLLKQSYTDAYDIYQVLMDDGVAREVARAVLPVGIYSSMYATCNPRSLMHFLGLRTKDEGATFPSYPMQEIHDVASGMERELAALFPVTYEAFNNHGRVSP